MAGNRGVGKTSLKNISLYKTKESLNNLYINIPYFNESKDLYKEILAQLPNSLNQKIDGNLDEFKRILSRAYQRKFFKEKKI